jgi:hypothetical protein
MKIELTNEQLSKILSKHRDWLLSSIEEYFDELKESGLPEKSKRRDSDYLHDCFATLGLIPSGLLGIEYVDDYLEDK